MTRNPILIDPRIASRARLCKDYYEQWMKMPTTQHRNTYDKVNLGFERDFPALDWMTVTPPSTITKMER